MPVKHIKNNLWWIGNAITLIALICSFAVVWGQQRQIVSDTLTKVDECKREMRDIRREQSDAYKEFTSTMRALQVELAELRTDIKYLREKNRIKIE